MRRSLPRRRRSIGIHAGNSQKRCSSARRWRPAMTFVRARRSLPRRQAARSTSAGGDLHIATIAAAAVGCGNQARARRIEWNPQPGRRLCRAANSPAARRPMRYQRGLDQVNPRAAPGGVRVAIEQFARDAADSTAAARRARTCTPLRASEAASLSLGGGRRRAASALKAVSSTIPFAVRSRAGIRQHVRRLRHAVGKGGAEARARARSRKCAGAQYLADLYRGPSARQTR